MESIFTRRSVRKYEDKEVENKKIDRLLRAAMQAPSAGNQRPWEFVVIKDKDTLQALSLMSPYSKLIADAPLAFVLLGNKERIMFMENWEQDMGAASQNILLEAVDLDLGSVWLSIAPLEERISHVKKVLNIPDHLMPYNVIAIGYPGEGQENKFVDRYEADRIHYEKI